MKKHMNYLTTCLVVVPVMRMNFKCNFIREAHLKSPRRYIFSPWASNLTPNLCLCIQWESIFITTYKVVLDENENSRIKVTL